MFQLENLKKLSIRIGITGGLITFITINTIPYFMNKRIKQTEVYEEAMKLVKSHSEAVKYLGEPIEDGHIVVTKEDLYGSDDEKAWFNIPVKGPKSVGNVYCETIFSKDEEGKKVEKTKLSKLELTVKSVPGYKLLIKRAE